MVYFDRVMADVYDCPGTSGTLYFNNEHKVCFHAAFVLLCDFLQVDCASCNVVYFLGLSGELGCTAESMGSPIWKGNVQGKVCFRVV